MRLGLISRSVHARLQVYCVQRLRFVPRAAVFIGIRSVIFVIHSYSPVLKHVHLMVINAC